MLYKSATRYCIRFEFLQEANHLLPVGKHIFSCSQPFLWKNRAVNSSQRIWWAIRSASSRVTGSSQRETHMKGVCFAWDIVTPKWRLAAYLIFCTVIAFSKGPVSNPCSALSLRRCVRFRAYGERDDGVFRFGILCWYSSPANTANTLFTHIYHCFTVTCFNGGFVSTFECRWGHIRAAFGAAGAGGRGETDPRAAWEAGPAKRAESNAGNIPGWCPQIRGKYAVRC